MKLIGGLLVHFLKSRIVRDNLNCRINLSLFSKQQTTENKNTNIATYFKQYFPDKFSFYKLLILSTIGLTGAVIKIKKKSFKEVHCDEVSKNVKDIESDQNPDFFLIDSCFMEAIKKSRYILENVKRLNNCPAITITVSVDGKELWSEGIGLSDVENEIPCTKKSVFRIASISKSITMAIIGKLVEDGLLDLDLPIQHYVPEWPDKFFNGAKAKITTRQIVSMLSGIRHYDRNCNKPKNQTTREEKKEQRDANLHEFYLNKQFKNVSESLTLFKNDGLCSMPGTEFLYSTHNFVLLSAIIEKVSGKKIEEAFSDLFRSLGLRNTYLDLNLIIVPHRAKYYNTNKAGKLQNAAPINNSYKWAGGGLQATSSDICKFGNIMLACYQGLDYRGQEVKTGDSPDKMTSDDPIKASTSTKNSPQKPYLSQSTMEMIWTPVKKARCPWARDGFYAMGWCSVPTRPSHAPGLGLETDVDYRKRQYFSHTGGAMGASSILLVMPRSKKDGTEPKSNPKESIEHKSKLLPRMPKGTVVSIITNMQDVSLNSSALEIAAEFETARKFHVRSNRNHFMDEDENVDPSPVLLLPSSHE